ncbi:unnamed protein product [Ambrosiozyma monospora]|uniref:Unnamed protein product n=1 Tax=Ambrosiozyma monospora TaxID=43982 RepID=A0ACB5U689_AMBMO|nr:unnamed protein product [Ambrosiozyma monospora]
MRAVVFTQSCYRRQAAKEEYKQLKVEAKSLNRMKEVQYSLENKVIELTQSLTSKVEENTNLVAKIEKLQSLVSESQEMRDQFKNRELDFNKKFDDTVSKHTEEVADLTEEINKQKLDYETAKAKVDELSEAHTKLKKELSENIEQLKEAQEQLDETKRENVSLNDAIERLRQELTDLQRNVGSGKYVANGTGLTPTRSRTIAGRGGSPLGTSSSNGHFETRPASIIAPYANDEMNLEAINTELV